MRVLKATVTTLHEQILARNVGAQDISAAGGKREDSNIGAQVIADVGGKCVAETEISAKVGEISKEEKNIADEPENIGVADMKNDEMNTEGDDIMNGISSAAGAAETVEVEYVGSDTESCNSNIEHHTEHTRTEKAEYSPTEMVESVDDEPLVNIGDELPSSITEPDMDD